jgi:hypothetical protein
MTVQDLLAKSAGKPLVDKGAGLPDVSEQHIAVHLAVCRIAPQPNGDVPISAWQPSGLGGRSKVPCTFLSWPGIASDSDQSSIGRSQIVRKGLKLAGPSPTLSLRSGPPLICPRRAEVGSKRPFDSM